MNTTLQQYNRIAVDFDRKRPSARDLNNLRRFVKPADLVLDAGCGNGRLTEVLRDCGVHLIGCDGAKKMITVARQHYRADSERGWVEFVAADLRVLPFARGQFDVIFCLAVLHHFPDAALQQPILRGLRRVAKLGGCLVGTVWNLTADQFRKRYQLGTGKDFIIPWKATANVTIKRHFHAFTLAELRNLLRATGWHVEVLQFVDRNFNKTTARQGVNIFWVAQAI